MRVLLVWPNFGEASIEYVPLALAFLKANVDPERHQVAILDTVLEDLAPDTEAFVRATEAFEFDLAAFSCTSNKFANTVRYAKQLKARYPRTPILVGGIHVTSYPDETMRFDCFDYGLAGEAEFSFQCFLDTLERGGDVSAVPGLCYRTAEGLCRNTVDRPPDLDSIRMPNYDDISLRRYWAKGYQFIHDKMDHAPIWISRGCPYGCRFCASRMLNGPEVRYHSPDYVETFIRRLHADFGVNHINIVDDNFTFEMNSAKEHLRRLIRLREELRALSFAFPNGIRMQRVDRELLQLMKKAGFEYVVFAPESGSPTMLQEMRKGMKADIIVPSVRMAKDVGLKVMTFWVVGYPGETRETLDETRRMIHRCGAEMVSLHVFAALPGTAVFEQLVTEGRIARTYLPQSYQRVGDGDYVTEGLSREDIASFIRKVYFQHYVLRPWNAWSQLRITGFGSIISRVRKVLFGRKTAPSGTVRNRVRPRKHDREVLYM